MDKLVKSWIVSLSYSSGFGIIMSLVSTAVLLRRGGNTKYEQWGFCLLCGLFLLGCVWQWLRLLRGRVLLHKHDTLSVNGGELTIPEYAGNYELWLFSGGWFTRYHGSISIKTSTGQTYMRKLRCRVPPFQSVRRNPAPI